MAVRGNRPLQSLSFFMTDMQAGIGLVAAHLITAWGVLPVQMLEGVGARLQSVAVPGVVARILNGTSAPPSARRSAAGWVGRAGQVKPACAGTSSV